MQKLSINAEIKWRIQRGGPRGPTPSKIEKVPFLDENVPFLDGKVPFLNMRFPSLFAEAECRNLRLKVQENAPFQRLNSKMFPYWRGKPPPDNPRLVHLRFFVAKFRLINGCPTCAFSALLSCRPPLISNPGSAPEIYDTQGSTSVFRQTSNFQTLSAALSYRSTVRSPDIVSN